MNLKHAYPDVNFINLSKSTIGIMGKSSVSLLLMLDNFNIDKSAQKLIIRKVMNIVITCTLYFLSLLLLSYVLLEFLRCNASFADSQL